MVLENISVIFTKLTEIASLLLQIAIGKRKNAVSRLFALLIIQTNKRVNVLGYNQMK